jgi:hypothetical protein
MKLNGQTKKTNLSARKLLMLSTLTAGLLFLMPRATADDWCQRQTERTEHKLHEAIEHHGYNSWQANHWRRELHEVRERCWRERQQWWDEHGRRWHHDRDWDDRDHDRD